MSACVGQPQPLASDAVNKRLGQTPGPLLLLNSRIRSIRLLRDLARVR